VAAARGTYCKNPFPVNAVFFDKKIDHPLEKSLLIDVYGIGLCGGFFSALIPEIFLA